MKKLILICGFCLFGCQSLPYEDDKGFQVSIQAGSHEFPLYVNEKTCKDSEGRVGACVFRIPSDQLVRFRHDPRPYAYTLIVNCSSAIDSDLRHDVPERLGHEWEIQPEKFSQVRAFTCESRVVPLDRGNQKIAAGWHFRAIVVDADYKPREQILPFRQEGKDYLVLGKFARHSTLCVWRENGSDSADEPFVQECEWLEEETIVEAPRDAQAYSESLLMRFNYYNF